MIGIKYMDYYIPKDRLSVNELFECISEDVIRGYFSSKEECLLYFKKTIGVKAIPIEKHKSEIEMYTSLIDKMLFKRIVSADEINLIITLEDAPTNYSGKEIQFIYNFYNADTLNLGGNQCVNFEYAVTFADLLMRQDCTLQSVLIIGSVKHDNYASRITTNYSLNGDAAGIMLLNRDSPLLEVKDSYRHSDSRFLENRKDSGGLVSSAIKELLAKVPQKEQNQTPFSAIITQNANISLILYQLVVSGYSTQKVFTKNISKYGHMNHLDYLINLQDVTEELRLTAANGHYDDHYICSLGASLHGSFIITMLKTNFNNLKN